MPTPDLRAAFGAILIAICSPAHAFDPSDLGEEQTPDVAMRYGYEAWKSGDGTTAADAFAFAARQDNVPAQWKLARMYQTGDGVERDERIAFDNYQAIARRFPARIAPPQVRAYVVSAHRALGRYLRHGLDDGRLAQNVRLAERHLYRAAALYGDRNAQFELAHLYQHTGNGGRSRLAARWYHLASVRGHALARVELAEMFIAGQGVAVDRVRGMYLLASARAKVGEGVRMTISERLLELMQTSTEPEITELTARVEAAGLDWTPSTIAALQTGG